MLRGKVAGQTQAKRAGVELVGLAFAVEGDGRDEEALAIASELATDVARPHSLQ